MARRSSSSRRARQGTDPPPQAVARILAAAEGCFRDGGYVGVSLREIAERAGVSKSLVLYHFDSKDHVFAELQLAIYRRLAAGIKAAVARAGGSPEERARMALSSLIEAVREGNDLALHIMLGARALTSPEASAHVRRTRRELRELLERTMHEIFGTDSNQLPVPLEAAADILWAALTGLGLQAVLDESPQELARGFESLHAIVDLAFQRSS